jgi:hypothetical protein
VRFVTRGDVRGSLVGAERPHGARPDRIDRAIELPGAKQVGLRDRIGPSARCPRSAYERAARAFLDRLSAAAVGALPWRRPRHGARTGAVSSGARSTPVGDARTSSAAAQPAPRQTTSNAAVAPVGPSSGSSVLSAGSYRSCAAPR